jgi:hypothetical protein
MDGFYFASDFSFRVSSMLYAQACISKKRMEIMLSEIDTINDELYQLLLHIRAIADASSTIRASGLTGERVALDLEPWAYLASRKILSSYTTIGDLTIEFFSTINGYVNDKGNAEKKAAAKQVASDTPLHQDQLINLQDITRMWQEKILADISVRNSKLQTHMQAYDASVNAASSIAVVVSRNAGAILAHTH